MIECKTFCRTWVLSPIFPIALILGIAAFGSAYRESATHMELLRNVESSFVRSTAVSTELEMNKMISGLRFLMGHDSLHKLDEEQKEVSFSILKDEFRHFSNVSGRFDQIRILDTGGMEVVRVNYGDDGAYFVEGSDLQDKSERYYFKEAIRLGPEQFYVSPFDLNVEKGKVEEPFKPMMRAAAPLFDADGNKTGVLVVNFLAQNTLVNLDHVSCGSRGKLMFLNQAGQWLLGGSEDCNWSFMFPDRKQCSFEDLYPGIWARIYENESGQFLTDDGLFTFKTIVLSPQENGETVAGAESYKVRKWKLVTHVSSGEVWKQSTLPYVLATVIYIPVLWLMVVITASKRRKDLELEHSLSEFEALFENSAIGIAYMKSLRVVHRVNSRFCEVVGYQLDELQGESTKKLYLSEKIFADFWKSVKSPLEEGKIVQRELQLRHKDGSVVWGSVTGRGVAPPELEKGIIWTLEDISGRKDLENLREDVDRIMRHDLKAPLNGIINLPVIIAEEGGLNEEQVQCLKMIEEAGMRMLNQINSSLNLYQIETGTYRYVPEVIDIKFILLKIVREYERFAAANDIKIILQFDDEQIQEGDDPLLVKGRDDFCQSMFSNILKNALEASPSGEQVTVSIFGGDVPVVKIHNFGSVPAEIHEVFFEKYSTSGKKNGLGLGSYSARLLMEAQLGKIEMETSAETGTAISFIFHNG
ncbi:PAS domain S-box protein [Desulfovibrio sp. JC022]|uniref:PAS domain S-box protein n=1 Tax=Desulfovibrio sp. JC022 TaxID=2593642 RepID=UPI0013D2910B|nr:PAS domain S-box protein [Desulfovibrio sp. JC022]NDV22035.1 PAS domain S-box protein [Desulfovibrio sp. JC022]